MPKILWENDLPAEMRPPRDSVADNVAFRARLMRECERDPKFRAAVRELCRDSYHFLVNVFGWTLDPRRRFDPVLPLVQWDCQERVSRGIVEAIEEGEDFFLEKSRDMGATWTVTTLMAWIWLSMPNTLSLAGSYKEERVDGKAGSMLRMVDFFLQRLPEFLLPEGYDPQRHRSYMRIYNPENESVIEGEATNPDFGRGERKTLMLFDEFARWGNRQAGLDEDAWEGAADVTLTRVALSTPQGSANHYYRLRSAWMAGRMRGDAMWFWEHPSKGIGTFQDLATRKLGGPYLEQEQRKRSQRYIEQELLIRYLGGGSPAFPKSQERLESLREELRQRILAGAYGTPLRLSTQRADTTPGGMVTGARPAADPWLLDPEQLASRFLDQRNFDGAPGILWEFAAPEPGWRNRYVISSDQAEGVEGGDFATVHVLDRGVEGKPARVVAAWRGRENSNVVAEIMHWLWRRWPGSYYAPEANAIGQATVLRLQEIHGPKLMRMIYRTETIGRDGRLNAARPGFVTTRRTKPSMVERVDMLLRADWCEVNCLQTACELFAYEKLSGGRYGAAPPMHDDAAMSFCIAMVAATSDQFGPPKKAKDRGRPGPRGLVARLDRPRKAADDVRREERWLLV